MALIKSNQITKIDLMLCGTYIEHVGDNIQENVHIKFDETAKIFKG